MQSPFFVWDYLHLMEVPRFRKLLNGAKPRNFELEDTSGTGFVLKITTGRANNDNQLVL
jgi:hypothetical protein